MRTIERHQNGDQHVHHDWQQQVHDVWRRTCCSGLHHLSQGPAPAKSIHKQHVCGSLISIIMEPPWQPARPSAKRADCDPIALNANICLRYMRSRQRTNKTGYFPFRIIRVFVGFTCGWLMGVCVCVWCHVHVCGIPSGGGGGRCLTVRLSGIGRV